MSLREYCYQFAFVLHHERVRKGLTQYALAGKTGIHQSVISRYESGRGNPNLKNIVVLAEFFEIRVAEFLLSRRSLMLHLAETPADGLKLPGVNFSTVSIPSGTETAFKIELLRQLAVRVIRGRLAVKTEGLGQMKLLEEGQWLIIPGGVDVMLAGIAEKMSEVELFESERTEVRGLEALN